MAANLFAMRKRQMQEQTSKSRPPARASLSFPTQDLTISVPASSSIDQRTAPRASPAEVTPTVGSSPFDLMPILGAVNMLPLPPILSLASVYENRFPLAYLTDQPSAPRDVLAYIFTFLHPRHPALISCISTLLSKFDTGLRVSILYRNWQAERTHSGATDLPVSERKVYPRSFTDGAEQRIMPADCAHQHALGFFSFALQELQVCSRVANYWKVNFKLILLSYTCLVLHSAWVQYNITASIFRPVETCVNSLLQIFSDSHSWRMRLV